MKKLLSLLVLVTISATIIAQPLQDKVDKTFNNITSIEAESVFCDVTINQGTGHDTHFKGEVYYEKGIKIVCEQNGSTLKVHLEGPKSYTGKCKGSFAFSVPENISLSIKSVSGDIIANNINKGKMNFAAVSGDITLSSIGSPAEIKTVSGDITVSGVKGNLIAKSTSGDHKITNISGDLNSKSVSGDMDIRNIAGSSDVATTSGDIKIDGAGNNMTLRSVSGEISTSNTNGNLSAATTSGNINLHKVSGVISTKTISGGVSGTEVTLTSNSSFITTSGDVNITISNSAGQLRFNLASTSGSLKAKGVTGKKSLTTGSGTIEITGKTLSGNQSYN